MTLWSQVLVKVLSKVIEIWWIMSILEVVVLISKVRRAYVQMDGEPWKQPLIQDQSTTVEISKVPYHSLMINRN